MEQLPLDLYDAAALPVEPLPVGAVVRVSWHRPEGVPGYITHVTHVPEGEYYHIDPVSGHRVYFARDDGSPVNGTLYYVQFARESHGYVLPEEIMEVVSNGR